MYKESVAAPNPHGCSITAFRLDFMKTYEESVKIERHKKYAPDTVSSERGAKNGSRFGCGKIPAKQVLCSRRSKVSASRPYAPDTREVCFQGPSRALWYFRLCPPRRVREQAESRNQFGAQSFGLCVGVSRVFALAGATVSYCCVAQ